MVLPEVISGVTVSAFAALATALAGLFTSWLSLRLQKQRKDGKADLDVIVEKVRTETDRTDVSFARSLEKIISNKTADQKADLENIKNDVIALKTSSSNIPAVENLIAGYHEQALGQARVQFWFSVMAATVGFAWIIYTGIDIRPDNLAGAVKALPGVVMDAVAFLFFKQASETRQRATDLYDRLRRDKQASESIALVSSIDDPRVRSIVKAQMALHMAGLSPDPINVGQYLSVEKLPASPNAHTFNAG